MFSKIDHFYSYSSAALDKQSWAVRVQRKKTFVRWL